MLIREFLAAPPGPPRKPLPASSFSFWEPPTPSPASPRLTTIPARQYVKVLATKIHLQPNLAIDFPLPASRLIIVLIGFSRLQVRLKWGKSMVVSHARWGVNLMGLQTLQLFFPQYNTSVQASLLLLSIESISSICNIHLAPREQNPSVETMRKERGSREYPRARKNEGRKKKKVKQQFAPLEFSKQRVIPGDGEEGAAGIYFTNSEMAGSWPPPFASTPVCLATSHLRRPTYGPHSFPFHDFQFSSNTHCSPLEFFKTFFHYIDTLTIYFFMLSSYFSVSILYILIGFHALPGHWGNQSPLAIHLLLRFFQQSTKLCRCRAVLRIRLRTALSAGTLLLHLVDFRFR